VKNALSSLLDHPSFTEGMLWMRRQVAANQTLFAEGEHGSEIYLILKGAVRVVGNVDLDDQRTVHPGFSDLDVGQVFGELPFLDGHPELAYPIFKELIHLLVGRLRQANRRIFSLFAWGLKMRGIDHHL
jgi:CRP/FNR family cyclic AMP-dependent transcriptional regulator